MNVKTITVIFLVIILFSFTVLASHTQRFGLEAHYEHFISAYTGRLLSEVGGRYWWKSGFGIEGNFGMYTHNGGPFPYYSARALITIIETSDLNLYATVGIYEVDYTSYRESTGTIGGHFKGVGVEFSVTNNLNLDLRINHYEEREVGGMVVESPYTEKNEYHFLTGAGIVYYF